MHENAKKEKEEKNFSIIYRWVAYWHNGKQFRLQRNTFTSLNRTACQNSQDIRRFKREKETMTENFVGFHVNTIKCTQTCIRMYALSISGHVRNCRRLCSRLKLVASGHVRINLTANCRCHPWYFRLYGYLLID